MKNTIQLFALFLVLGFSGALVAQQQVGEITRVIAPASKQAYIHPGDTLQTGVGGRLRARLADGSLLSLGPQSSIKVISYDSPTRHMRIEVLTGTARFEVQHVSHFEVSTSVAMCVPHGGELVVDATNPTATVVAGNASVRSTDARHPEAVEVPLGKSVVVRTGEKPEPQEAGLPARSE